MSTRPADRAVIQISKPLHLWLLQVKKEREQQLGRQVSISEIIEQLREKAGAA